MPLSDPPPAPSSRPLPAPQVEELIGSGRPRAEPRCPGPRRSAIGPLLAAVLVLLGLTTALLPTPADAQAQQNRRGVNLTPKPATQSRPIDEAQAALRARAPARALAIADQALKTHPADAELRFVRGIALVSLQRSDEAEAAFRGLTQDYPELPEPYNNLAWVLAARGDLDGARMALDEAVRALPDYALAHENLGDILVRLAARHYTEANRLAAGANRTIVESTASKLRLVNEIQPGVVRPTQSAPAPASTSTNSSSSSSSH